MIGRLGALAAPLLLGLAGSTVAQHPASSPFAAEGPSASPRIEALRAVAGRDPTAVDRFWADVRRLGAPLIEPVPGDPHASLATFVYRGSASTRNVVITDGVAVAIGGVDPRNSELIQLPGTDVWYRTYRLRNDARFSYKVSENDPLVSFIDLARKSDSKADPFNPRLFATGHSYLELPEAPSQDVTPRPNDPRGAVERTVLHSDRLGNDRDVWT